MLNTNNFKSLIWNGGKYDLNRERNDNREGFADTGKGLYREIPALFLRGEGYRLKGFVQDTAKQGAGAL